MALSMWSNLNTDDSWGLRHCLENGHTLHWRPWSSLLSFMTTSSYLSFLCWALLDLNAKTKLHFCGWVPFWRFLQLWVAAQAWFLCCLSNFVPADSLWQCHYFEYYSPGPSSSYSHVLFPKHAVHLWDLLYCGHHSLYAFWPLEFSSDHFSPRLCHSALFLSNLWYQ